MAAFPVKLRSQIVMLVLSLLVSSAVSGQPAATAQDIRVQTDGHFYLRFSHNGRFLHMVGVSPDEVGQLHQVRAVTYAAKTGEVIHVINLQPDTDVYSSTSDGRTAIVATSASGEHGRFFLLDTETGQLQAIPDSWYPQSDPYVDISGDGRLVSIYSWSERETDAPMTVDVYDWRTKTLVATRTSGSVSAGGFMAGGLTEDGEVEFEGNRVGSTIVDLKTGRVMAQFGPSSVRSPNGAWEIQFPNLSWDESSSTHVLLKNGANGRTIGMFNVHVLENEQNGSLGGVFCGASARFIMVSDHAVTAYILPSRKLLANIPAQTWRASSGDSYGASVACSTDGTRVAILSGGRLTFHDLK
jgi:hypothetical protein